MGLLYFFCVIFLVATLGTAICILIYDSLPQMNINLKIWKLCSNIMPFFFPLCYYCYIEATYYKCNNMVLTLLFHKTLCLLKKLGKDEKRYINGIFYTNLRI